MLRGFFDFRTLASRVGAALLVVAVLAPTLWELQRGLGLYIQSVLNVQDGDVAMAKWLEGRLPPDALLAVNDIGALGFFLPNRLIDLAGIGNPELFDYMREASESGRPAMDGVGDFVHHHRPDYLVIFPTWYPDLASDTQRFQILHRVEVPNNITMGGDEIVLMSTPWTRSKLIGD